MKSLVVFLFPFYILSYYQPAPKIRADACPVSECSFFSHNETYQRCVQNGTIHLTFDDGPLPAITDQLLDLLQMYNISATFFINGHNWPNLDEPETRATVRRAVRENIRVNRKKLNNLTKIIHPLIKGVVDKLLIYGTKFDGPLHIISRDSLNGHRVEHHTWSHRPLTSQTTDSIRHEMNTLSDKIYEVLGFRPTLMRPPYGYFNNTVYDIVGTDLGYKFILWSLCTCDWNWDIESSMWVYKEILDGTDPTKTPGFISLHHDPVPISLDLARLVIEYVQTTGYRFVSMKECLGF